MSFIGICFCVPSHEDWHCLLLTIHGGFGSLAPAPWEVLAQSSTSSFSCICSCQMGRTVLLEVKQKCHLFATVQKCKVHQANGSRN